MMKIVMAYSGAVLSAFVLGSILATQFVLANVSSMGMDVTTGIRLQTTLHDLAGLAASYLPMVAVALLIALLCAAGLARLLPGHRTFLYLLAGAVGLMAIHLLMKALLGLSGIAATRTVMGLLCQGLAGAVGGYVFIAIRRASSDKPAQ